MTIHKNTKLLPKARLEIFNKYHNQEISIAQLARDYHVSRPTIYKVLVQVRKRQIYQRKSINKRFRCTRYGLKRLARIELKIQNKLKNQAKRYNKSYPGEMVHFDVKRLPLLKGETRLTHRYQYLFVGIDDFSRELFAAILPDKASLSAERFLVQVLEECPYIIECAYSDNGKEFKGNPDHHPFMLLCEQERIAQRFTRVRRPQTNGKAERVIRTLMDMWHCQEEFTSRDQRQISLNRFINYYNTAKPHASLKGKTPFEQLIEYFFKEQV
jgi:transposase InsO family protein